MPYQLKGKALSLKHMGYGVQLHTSLPADQIKPYLPKEEIQNSRYVDFHAGWWCNKSNTNRLSSLYIIYTVLASHNFVG